jgi:hypothetical protein
MPKKVTAFACQRTGEIFPSASAAAKSENVLDRKKFAELKSRIKAGKYWVPKPGDYVYTDTRLSIDHGWDDVQGGLSIVTRVYESMSGGDPRCKFIAIAQHGRGGNWTQFLHRQQAELMERHGTVFSYPDPDFETEPEPWPL